MSVSNEPVTRVSMKYVSVDIRDSAQGFFLFFPGRTGDPPGGENFARPPPHDHCPRFLTRACPPNWILSPKISNFYLIFLSILTTFKLKTVSENSILCLNTRCESPIWIRP